MDSVLFCVCASNPLPYEQNVKHRSDFVFKTIRKCFLNAKASLRSHCKNIDIKQKTCSASNRHAADAVRAAHLLIRTCWYTMRKAGREEGHIMKNRNLDAFQTLNAARAPSRKTLSCAIAAALLLAPGAMPVMADDMNGQTDFYINYIDAAGFQLGDQHIRADDQDGTVELRADMLELPEGFVVDDSWQTITVAAGEDAYPDVMPVHEDPQVEAQIEQESKESASSGVLTMVYRQEDGAIAGIESFLRVFRPSAGGRYYVFEQSNGDYSANVPSGYALSEEVQPQYEVPIGGRRVVDLKVAAASDDAARTGAKAQSRFQITYLEEGTVRHMQTLTIEGEDDLVLREDMLELPEGYALAKPLGEYSAKPNMDMGVMLEIVKETNVSSNEDASSVSSAQNNQNDADAASQAQKPTDAKSASTAYSTNLWLLIGVFALAACGIGYGGYRLKKAHSKKDRK